MIIICNAWIPTKHTQIFIDIAPVCCCASLYIVSVIFVCDRGIKVLNSTELFYYTKALATIHMRSILLNLKSFTLVHIFKALHLLGTNISMNALKLLESDISVTETGRVLLRWRRGGGNGRQLSWALKIWGKQARQPLSSLRARERESKEEILRKRNRDWKQECLMFLYY
jgi:hypothetical protein